MEQNVGRGRFGTLLVAATVFLSFPASGAGPNPDPMLHAAPPEGCRGGVDYVPGMDTEGRPVVPADSGARPVPVPPQIVMPLPNKAGGADRRGYVVLDGAQIDALVNPPPCRD